MNNYAFIDGQNLYLGITSRPDAWKIDLYRFRNYLRQKYNVVEAHYFLGCVNEKLQELYDLIRNAGFTIIFREHNSNTISEKKGNVDTDIVFEMMKNFHEFLKIDKFYLVSGDGDYYKTVEYLVSKDKFGKILFPAHRKASSLYRRLGNSYYDYLDNPGVKNKIRMQ